MIRKIIREAQSAFIEGRSILDGVVILNELIDEARSSRAKRLFLKVDFAKAYDSVDKNYLIRLLQLLNFPDK